MDRLIPEPHDGKGDPKLAHRYRFLGASQAFAVCHVDKPRSKKFAADLWGVDDRAEDHRETCFSAAQRTAD